MYDHNYKMSKNQISSLKNLGYTKKIPKHANIDNYESIVIQKNNGNKITLYRMILSEKKTYDDDFKKSWEIFNSYL